jgi:hypothetical protein
MTALNTILIATNAACLIGMLYLYKAWQRQRSTVSLSPSIATAIHKSRQGSSEAEPKKKYFRDEIQNQQLLNEQLQNIVYEMNAIRAAIYQVRNGLVFLGGKPIFKIELTNEYALQGYRRFMFEDENKSVNIEPYLDVLYDLLKERYVIRYMDSVENTPILNRRFHEAGIKYSTIIRVENDYGDIVAILSIGFGQKIDYNTFDLPKIMSLQERVKAFLLA